MCLFAVILLLFAGALHLNVIILHPFLAGSLCLLWFFFHVVLCVSAVMFILTHCRCLQPFVEILKLFVVVMNHFVITLSLFYISLSSFVLLSNKICKLSLQTQALGALPITLIHSFFHALLFLALHCNARIQQNLTAMLHP